MRFVVAQKVHCGKRRCVVSDSFFYLVCSVCSETMVRPQAGHADWMPRKPSSCTQLLKEIGGVGLVMVPSNRSACRDSSRRIQEGATVWRHIPRFNNNTSRQVQTATAYHCLRIAGNLKSTIDRTEVFVKRPVTQVPIYLHLALLVIQRSPTIAGKAPSYSLSSCPSKLQSSILNSTAKLHKLNSIPYQSHIYLQWLLSRSVTLCPRASSSSTYLYAYPSQSIQVLTSSFYALRLQLTGLPRAPY